MKQLFWVDDGKSLRETTGVFSIEENNSGLYVLYMAYPSQAFVYPTVEACKEKARELDEAGQERTSSAQAEKNYNQREELNDIFEIVVQQHCLNVFHGQPDELSGDAMHKLYGMMKRLD